MLPNKFNVVQRVHNQNPGLIHNAHAFTNAVAYQLWLEDQSWGHNVKRGTQGLSEDAICKLDNASPLKVTISHSPNHGRGIYVIDIIAGAGGPNPTPAWIDQTQATLNGGTTADWSKPVPVDTNVPKPEQPKPEVPTCQFQPTVCKFVEGQDVKQDIQDLRNRIEELATHFDTTIASLTTLVGQLQARKTCRFL